MKRIQKLLALALALLMLLGLSACGLSDLPVIKSILGITQHDSFHVDLTGEFGMDAHVPAYGMEVSVGFTAAGEGDYRAAPLQFAADIRAEAQEEIGRLLLYGEDRSGSFVLSYSLDGGATWGEKALGNTADISSGIDSGSSLSFTDMLKLGKGLSTAFSGFTKAGRETVNGQEATRYDASMRLRLILNEQSVRDAVLQALAEQLKTDVSALEGKLDFSAAEDVYFSFWLEDKDSRLVQIRIDMADAMNSLLRSGLLDAVLESAGLPGDLGLTADLSAMNLTLTFSNFNGVDAVTRPSGEPAV